MHEPRTERARHTARRVPVWLSAPRAAAFCRLGSPLITGFAPLLLVLAGILPAAVPSAHAAMSVMDSFVPGKDRDGNGIEDVLDAWREGNAPWDLLRTSARSERADAALRNGGLPTADKTPATGGWADDRLRILRFGPMGTKSEQLAARRVGTCRLRHSIDRFGGVEVLEVDATGLRAYLDAGPGGRIQLDRAGVPALATSTRLVGAIQAAEGHWSVGEDWTTSVAILDSGCDTAHGDLGDALDDDVDGPAPAVGDANDWHSAESGWPTADRYKVVGWHDVTDDFPEAQGPWDYHYHGTALASVVAGSGVVDPYLAGLAPATRLTIVKFYDFDEIWHTWAGDFLAACDWTLNHRDVYRIRTVLTAVNWPVDAGISAAMDAFVEAGILPVAAMGNEGPGSGTPSYPASSPQALTIGAVNDQGAVSAFSSRGYPGGTKPDLVAPGGGLLASAGRIMACDNEPDDSYSGRFGTSLAAAHAAGALALLDEALRKSGLDLPPDRESVSTRKALLKAGSAVVSQAEVSTGLGDVQLPDYEGADEVRGWGLLRADAAIEAALEPLAPGHPLTEYISSDWDRPVIARRLVLQAGVNYLIEASPVGSLDVSLEIFEPHWQSRPDRQDQALRRNAFGPGVSEFLYWTPDSDQSLFLAVKRVSGSGTLSVEVKEADAFSQLGGRFGLPGVLSAPPNFGRFDLEGEPVIAVPSRVAVDQQARALNVFDGSGVSLPEFPVFVFPNPSAQGGLTTPMLMDMDGVAGDEVLVGSEYGTLYFFAADGSWQEVEVEFNEPLTAPVGWVDSADTPLVVTVARNGRAVAYSHGPSLAWSRDLGHQFPLAPAVGQMTGPANEELVVAFEDGTVFVLSELGQPMPGWPVDLGMAPVGPPVTCDLDDDGFHEVAIPCRQGGTGPLTMRILQGNGQPATGDGALLPNPGGGDWLTTSAPSVIGRYGAGDLRVVVAGLADNGLGGENTRWNLSLGEYLAPGEVRSTGLPGFSVRAATGVGVLTLDRGLIATPLGWNSHGGTGTEAHTLAHLAWQEILVGLSSIPGQATAWMTAAPGGRPLATRQEQNAGGPQGDEFVSIGAVAVPLGGNIYLRVTILGDEGQFVPFMAGAGNEPLWSSDRADSRNSGSYPLRILESPVPDGIATAGILRVWPNPTSTKCRIAWEGADSSQEIVWEIFDLRGRLIRRLPAQSPTVQAIWDARDGSGRSVSTGAYFVRARRGGQTRVSRIVLQR